MFEHCFYICKKVMIKITDNLLNNYSHYSYTFKFDDRFFTQMSVVLYFYKTVTTAHPDV